MTAMFCVHPDPRFEPDGSRTCQTCDKVLTDDEGYSGGSGLPEPWGSEGTREFVVRCGDDLDRRSQWHSGYDATRTAMAQAETVGVCVFTEFDLDDQGIVNRLRIWSRTGLLGEAEWVAGEWARPALAGVVRG